jgi:hypothetical protein
MAEVIEKVKERPILFSTPMVKAILEGRKTVTRRVVNPQPLEDYSKLECGIFHQALTDRKGDLYPGPETFGIIADDGEFCLKSPYGSEKDILWVRETWGWVPTGKGETVGYKASHDGPMHNKWKPSIHMPRAACRLRLEILSITVEKLQDISEEDAIREGIEPQPAFENIPQWKDYTNNGCTTGWPCVSFASLWQSINGKESWDANPFCWVINFRKL